MPGHRTSLALLPVTALLLAGPAGGAPSPSQRSAGQQAGALLGTSAIEASEYASDLAARGSGRESGAFVVLVSLSSLSALTIGAVGLGRRRRAREVHRRGEAVTAA